VTSCLGLYANAFPKNAIRSDPSVDSTAIIADLKSFAADGLHQMQIFSASDLTKYDVTDRESGTIDRRDRAKIAGFDSSLHRRAPRTKRNGLSGTKLAM
jgi:hypothetical protein